MRLKIRFFNISIINMHAETEDKDVNTKENFYLELERAYDGTSSNDTKVVIGDCNAKIGREPVYKKTIGNQSLHETSNDNGLRVIDFVSSRDMLICSTCFVRPDIHKWTWISPDVTTQNQIDHILINKRHASNVRNVRTYRGANCESDYFLVCMKYKSRMLVKGVQGKRVPGKLQTEKLNKFGTIEQYQLNLAEELDKRIAN